MANRNEGKELWEVVRDHKELYIKFMDKFVEDGHDTSDKPGKTIMKFFNDLTDEECENIRSISYALAGSHHLLVLSTQRGN